MQGMIYYVVVSDKFTGQECGHRHYRRKLALRCRKCQPGHVVKRYELGYAKHRARLVPADATLKRKQNPLRLEICEVFAGQTIGYGYRWYMKRSAVLVAQSSTRYRSKLQCRLALERLLRTITSLSYVWVNPVGFAGRNERTIYETDKRNCGGH